jgi:IMP dehydrogenase
MDDLNGKLIKEGYTFDDLLLVPAHSTVVPANVDLATTLTSRLRLKLPILSAAMDTVTEAAMATALAKAGGLGILHKNMPIEAQAGHGAFSQKRTRGSSFNGGRG